MTATPLDLAFKVGDLIRESGGSIRRRIESVEPFLIGGKCGPRYTDVVTNQPANPKHWVFACHNNGAPFEYDLLDEAAAYKDGYDSGLFFGMLGRFYLAGGPLIWTASANDCRHLKQAAEFSRRNNKAFKTGWAEGQERARMKKPLDFTRPLRLVATPDTQVHYVGKLSPDGHNHAITLGTKFDTIHKIDEFGGGIDVMGRIVVENVPVRVVQYNAWFRGNPQLYAYTSLKDAKQAWADKPMSEMQYVERVNEGDKLISLTIVE